MIYIFNSSIELQHTWTTVYRKILILLLWFVLSAEKRNKQNLCMRLRFTLSFKKSRVKIKQFFFNIKKSDDVEWQDFECLDFLNWHRLWKGLCVQLFFLLKLFSCWYIKYVLLLWYIQVNWAWYEIWNLFLLFFFKIKY